MLIVFFPTVLFLAGWGVAIPPRDLNPANDHILLFAK